MELVIDRSKWLRGDGEGEGRLLKNGKMCCLGFFGRALGIPDAVLGDCGSPMFAKSLAWPHWLFTGERNTEACHSLIVANDSDTISDADREQEVAAEFARHGVVVRFVDGTEQPLGPQKALP